MDSLQRRPQKVPLKKITPVAPELQTPILPKREELYISRNEVLSMERQAKSFRKKNKLRKILVATLLITLLIIISWLGYFFWKAYTTSKKMNSRSSSQTTLAKDLQAMTSPILSPRAPLSGQQEGRINILLLGAAGQHNPGGNLTDTVMVMSINTKDKKVALLSLPRDLYVQIPDSQSFTKINSLYPIGLKQDQGTDLVKEAVEKITGIKIQYYLTVDFDGFQKIVDDIGGINVISERDINDPRYPGPNYSYENFTLAKGLHNFDGATTLKYVRERHDDPEGDFGRAKRQQQVIQAVKNKLFSAQTLFNVVAMNNVLNSLGDNIRTNITFEDLGSFIELSKQVDTQNITNVVADAWNPGSLLKVSHVQVGNVSAFILVPRVGNYSEIQDLAQNIFDQTELKRRQEAISNEAASISIINQSGNNAIAQKIQKLLSEKLGMKDVKIIPNSKSGISDQTEIFDKSNGTKIFTVDELVKKLPATLADKPATLATASSDIIDDKSDITIAVGKDLVNTYKYDEASIEEYNKAQDEQDNIDLLNKNN